jgi:hypothetical protein
MSGAPVRQRAAPALPAPLQHLSCALALRASAIRNPKTYARSVGCTGLQPRRLPLPCSPPALPSAPARGSPPASKANPGTVGETPAVGPGRLAPCLPRQGQALRALRGRDEIDARPRLHLLAAKEKFRLHRARRIGQNRVYAKIASPLGEPSSFPARKPAPPLAKNASSTTNSRRG